MGDPHGLIACHGLVRRALSLSLRSAGCAPVEPEGVSERAVPQRELNAGIDGDPCEA